MRFTLNRKRVVIGHSVSVKVAAASGEVIARVVTRLDGTKLGDDRLSPNEVQYERIFEQAGGAGPGREHTLIVSATNDAGETRTASLRWQDTV
jgi:hypothetical protein